MKKLLIGMALLSTLSSPLTSFAEDEYTTDNTEHAGKTVAIVKGTAHVITAVSSAVYDHIKDMEADHVIEVGYEENDEIGGEGASRFIRYTVDTAVFDDSEMSDSLGLQVLPIKLTVEAADGKGLSVREARIALLKVQSDFGISVETMAFTKGDDEGYGTSILGEDLEKVTYISLKYSDVIYGSDNGNHKVIFKAYSDFNWDEKVTNLDKSREYKYHSAYDYGAALGYQYRNEYLDTKITPEVFYRTAHSSARKERKTKIRLNEGYNATRVGFQLVLQKTLMKKDCKLTFGVAKEEITGDMNINNTEVYAKGKCHF
jgi:hypothetical protein